MNKIFLLLFTFCFSLASHAFAQKQIPIIVYHSIEQFSGHGLKGLYVSPENFEKQMMYLKNHGFTLLTFEHWQERKKVNKPIFITFDDGYKNNLNALITFQKLSDHQFKPSATIFVISDFVGRPNRLTARELKMLSSSGFFSIQSHTATHPDLTKINDYVYQFKHSKEMIEQITGKPVIAISYPFGKVNDRIVEDVKKYYQYGLTDSSAYINNMKDQNYLLPRTYILYSTTIEEFAQIVNSKKSE